MSRRLWLLAAVLLLANPAFAERDYTGLRGGGLPPPFSLETDGITVILSGRAQVQGALLVGEDARLDAGDAATGNPGIRLRRARLGVEGEIYRARIGVEIDLLRGSSALHEAYLGYDSKYAIAYMGLVKVPMSRSALISSQSLQLSERSIGVRSIAPSQQLGLTVGGQFWNKRIRVLAGLFNGMDRAKTEVGGWARIDPTDGNKFGGFATAARLDVEPLGLLGSGIADLRKGRRFRLGIGGGFLYNGGESITALAYSGDLALKWRGLAFMAEYLASSREPTEAPTQTPPTTAEIESTALVTQLGYTILKNALEISTRFELVDENKALEDEGDFMAIAGAASYYLLDGHVKLQLSYQHRMESHGAELKNDVFMLNAEGRF